MPLNFESRIPNVFEPKLDEAMSCLESGEERQARIRRVETLRNGDGHKKNKSIRETLFPQVIGEPADECQGSISYRNYANFEVDPLLKREQVDNFRLANESASESILSKLSESIGPAVKKKMKAIND